MFGKEIMRRRPFLFHKKETIDLFNLRQLFTKARNLQKESLPPKHEPEQKQLPSK